MFNKDTIVFPFLHEEANLGFEGLIQNDDSMKNENVVFPHNPIFNIRFILDS